MTPGTKLGIGLLHVDGGRLRRGALREQGAANERRKKEISSKYGKLVIQRHGL
jgi:hypothetical protein